MPQQPPALLHIRIDMQEQRSGIPALLAAMPQVHIEVTPLHVGDYDVGGSTLFSCRGYLDGLVAFPYITIIPPKNSFWFDSPIREHYGNSALITKVPCYEEY